eukprot:5338796-Ditylum_brightwellii.AAC.1
MAMQYQHTMQSLGQDTPLPATVYRVQEPFIGRYCEHYLCATSRDRVAHKDAIIPDLLIHSYPVGKERKLDDNSIS